ncbi:membrane protein [Rhodopirellula sallentina SM41]|uniref:Membrane protein n=1 Tax=Rhodopirellula sallentina SM41 TaxID=1263870 RepID=M5TRR9_9BACT|nr:membrane protein [Rhodopirellula sallentina SM41]
MHIKTALRSYGDAWRTTFHFIAFGIAFSILTFPFRLLGIVTGPEPSWYIAVPLIFALVVYLPFSVAWASRLTGVRPRTPKEQEEHHRKIVDEKNAQLRRETSRKPIVD